MDKPVFLVCCRGDYIDHVSKRARAPGCLEEMAENIEPNAKRARKPNFSPAECAIIFDEVCQNVDIIKSKFSNNITNKNKARVWENVKAKVNALGNCLRTTPEKQSKFDKKLIA